MERSNRSLTPVSSAELSSERRLLRRLAKISLCSPASNMCSLIRGLVCLALMAPAIMQGASTRTWIASGANDDWSDSANWSDSNRPDDANETAAFAGGNAGTFTSASNQLTIRSGTNVFAPYGIRNESTKSITFQNRLGIDANMEWAATNASGGSMNFQNTVDTNGNTLTFATSNVANSITVSGAIIDTGSIIKTGAGTLTLSGTTANTYTGTTTVNDGTLTLAKPPAPTPWRVTSPLVITLARPPRPRFS